MANWNALATLMTPRKATSETLGRGMAQKAGEALESAGSYTDYVVETTEAGGSPMSRAEWLKSKG